MDGRKFDGIVKTLATETSRRGVLGAGLATVAALVTRRASAADKVTICHFTNSKTNPYNIITVDDNSVQLQSHLAHGDTLFVDCCLDEECAELTDQCNIGVCDAGTCIAVPQVGDPCDDGNLCTEGDVCQSDGSCAGTAVDCTELDNACNVGACNPADGSCLAEPANEGGPCDDQNACTGPDTCSGGVCTSGPTISCDDGNVCTDDSCDPIAGCAHTPNTLRCTLENGEAGVCVEGECVPPPNQPCETFHCGDPLCADRPDLLDDCACFERTENPENGLCLGNYLCGSTPPCNVDADCPAGWTCTTNTCCGLGVQACAPPCPEEGALTSQSLVGASPGGPDAAGQYAG
jgi:hypothetical protein